MDLETKKLLEEQAAVAEIVNNPGWKVIREKFFNKLLSLQNVFEISDLNKTTIREEIKARKVAHDWLTDFWQDIEGTKAQAEDNSSLRKKKTYLHIQED